MEEQLQATKNELTSLSIKDLFYKYIRFLPLFIISIALSLFVAYAYLRYATLIYRSTGTLVIQDDKNSNTNSNDKFEQVFESDNKKNIQNEIEYLQSRQMMSRVVKALNLNFTYLAQGKIKELNVYKYCPLTVEALQIADSSSGFTLNVDFENDQSFRINSESPPISFGQVFKNRYGVFRVMRNPNGTVSKNYKVTWQPTISVASQLASSVAIAPKQNTGILVITMEATNPQFASDVINQLMIEYQQATIDDKNSATRKKLDFIDRELDTVSNQLDTITQKMLLFKKANNLVDPGIQSANYFTRIEEADKQRKEQSIQLNNAFQIESYLRTRSSSIVPSSLGIGDPTLNNLVTAYNQAQMERKILLENAPPGNVTVQQKTEIIENLRQKILENVKNIKTSFSSVIGSLQKISGEAESEIRLMPEKQQKLIEIQRQMENKLVVNNSLIVQREASAIALASTISNIKVLQDALPDNTPVKPNRLNTRLLAILIGIILPALFIFILELLNDKVTTRNDIERLTNTTILGEVGHSYGKEALVVTNNNRGVVAEQFRILRSNLQYILNNIQKPVILVTSTFSGEGKSFVSTNIGAVLALASKKTIILEFDIRKPKILSQFNLNKKPGLTNYLLGKVNVEALPIAVEANENLFVLPCGPVPPNPAELLLDAKINDLFIYLRQNFDVIIMDTAPIGMVSDAMSLSKYADATLYIVRQGYTYKKQIGLIDEFHRESKLPKMSIVLNDIKIRTGYGYYGYGRYGYGYGYGSGYFDDDEGQSRGFLDRWFGWLETKKWNKKKTKRTKL